MRFLIALGIVMTMIPTAVQGQGRWNRRTESGSDDLARPSTSSASADQVTRKIPWQYFSQHDQIRMRDIISNHTLYRRLPIAGGFCNPEMFDFILCHPETIVGLWETLGYTDLSLRKTGPWNYLLQDNAGTEGDIEIMYQSDEMVVMWCNGSYRGPVKSGAIIGEMLIVLQNRFTEDAERKPVVVCRLDSFVRVKNVGIDLMGRIFGPALGRIADNNFDQTFVFVGSLSKMAEESPDTFRDLVLRTTLLTPQTRQNLLTIAQRVRDQYEMRQSGRIVAYQLLAKKGQEHGNFARILNRDPGLTQAAVQALRPEPSPNAPSTLMREPVPTSHAALTPPIQTIPKQDYAIASEQAPFAANVSSAKELEATLPPHPILDEVSSPTPRPIDPLVPDRAPMATNDITQTRVAKPVAEIPSPVLLENRTTLPAFDAAPPFADNIRIKSQTPPLSGSEVKQPKPEEKNTRIEIIPESSWRSVKTSE